jgi:acyl carrier protein
MRAEGDAETTASSLEQQVHRSWAESLHREDISADDDFFRIGGHSMRAMQVMRQLSRQLGVRLPTQLIFDNRTPRLLVAAVRNRLGASAS